VRFAAAHPELNQIMVHEGTEDSDRLRWMVERHVRAMYDAISASWQPLREAGIAAPLDPAMVHYVIVGAASMPYVNAPEAR
jgi:TetR/AcrR family transcriptional regulator